MQSLCRLAFVAGAAGAAIDTTAHREAHARLQAYGECVEPDPRGYLLYLTFAQQFNNQLISVVENIRLAQSLGRVLVLPGFMEHRQGPGEKASDGHDYYDGDHVLKPFGDYFDIDRTLGRFGLQPWTGDGRGHYMTLNQFNKLGLCGSNGLGNIFPMRAEAHSFVSHWEPQPAGNKLERVFEDGWVVPEHIYKCPQQGPDCGESGFVHDRSNPLYDLQMSFKSVKVVVHSSADVLMLGWLPRGDDVPMLVTDNFFYTYNNTVPSYLPDGEPGLLDGLSNFVWVAEVERHAEDFIKSQFGGQSFLAMHWRRGYTDGTIPIRSLGEVADILRSRTPYGAEGLNIYMASNQLSEGDIAELEAALGDGRRIVNLGLSASTAGMDPNLVSHVEMLICTRARNFIKTPGSTWSYNVEAFRGNRQATRY